MEDTVNIFRTRLISGQQIVGAEVIGGKKDNDLPNEAVHWIGRKRRLPPNDLIVTLFFNSFLRDGDAATCYR